MGNMHAAGLFAAVAELVGQGLRLDAALTASGSTLGPDQMADALEQKRRITAALFAVLPAALETCPTDKPALLNMVREYDQSHLRVTALLEPRDRPATRHLRRLWRDGQVLETYLSPAALRKAA